MPYAKFEPDSEEEGFINKIKDDYFDDTARLVFADFLEERGDPRGPYMRLQVEMALLQQAEADRFKRQPAHTTPRAEFLTKQLDLTHRMSELHNEHGGNWYGPLWGAAAWGQAGHRYVRGMMRICGSPASFSYVPVQKALAWADTIQVDHDAGGVTALEKVFERNQVCCVSFSSYTVMMQTMRLRFLRWLHRKTRRLPTRVVALELGQGLAAEAFDLIGKLPDRVLDQVKLIQAGPDWNDNTSFESCETALLSREWTGKLVRNS